MESSRGWTRTARHLTWVPLGALLAVAACQHPDSATGPASNTTTGQPGSTGGGAPVFSSTATIGDLQTQLDSGTARLRIVLVPDSLVARRIVIERPRALNRSEEVEGRVVAVAVGDMADTLTLDIGGLQVVLDSTTWLRGEHEWGDRDDDDQVAGSYLATFGARLQAKLAEGRRPFIEARRRPPADPQAPDDSSFVARTIRFDDPDESPEIEINADSFNLTANMTPPPDAWVTVLGRKIEIRSTTVIKADLPPTTNVVEFSDTVTAADTVAGTATLAGGEVLRIVAGTEFETWGTAALGSLADVEKALADSKVVLAHGRGLLETATPPTFDVIEVVFRLGS